MRMIVHAAGNTSVSLGDPNMVILLIYGTKIHSQLSLGMAIVNGFCSMRYFYLKVIEIVISLRLYNTCMPYTFPCLDNSKPS